MATSHPTNLNLPLPLKRSGFQVIQPLYSLILPFVLLLCFITGLAHFLPLHLLTVYLDGYFYAHGQFYSPSVYSDHDIAEDHIVEKPIVEEQRYAKNVTFKGSP
jgi:hypothetical protein